jgi:FPC/CPF motif-containing protein YcgG
MPWGLGTVAHICNSSFLEDVGRRFTVQDWHAKKFEILSEKITKSKRGWVEPLDRACAKYD